MVADSGCAAIALRAPLERDAAPLRAALLDALDLRRRDVDRLPDGELRALAASLLADILAREPRRDGVDGSMLAKFVLDEAIGLGPLEDLFGDDSITEIMVNGPSDVFVERAGRLHRVATTFSSDKALRSVIERIVTRVGRRVDEGSPMVDARMADGSRVNVVLPPLSLRGPVLTIRRFPRRRPGLDDLLAAGTIDGAMLRFLEVCVRQRRNVIVGGGTGTGKTTLLNVLSNLIPPHERIVTIEDAAELALRHANVVSLEARPRNLEGEGLVTIRDLVRNALRMRPDRIVVGECRGGEALDMLQAMNTGHDGSLTTAHANTPRDLLRRLEVMTLMAGIELPLLAIREQIAGAVHVVVQQARFPCGSRRVTQVTEVTGVESGTIQMQEIFRFERQGSDADGRVIGRFRPSGYVPAFYEELSQCGLHPDVSIFEPRN